MIRRPPRSPLFPYTPLSRSWPYAGLREEVHTDFPPWPTQASVPRIREAFVLERLQRPRNMTAEEPSPFRDSGLGRFPPRFRDVPESVEMDEDAFGRGELHPVPMRSRLLKRASHDSHAIRGW